MQSLSLLMQQLPITYRQVDHALRQGYVKIEDADPGSGNHRLVSDSEARVLRLYSDLIVMGMRPPKAGEIAEALANGNGVWQVGGVRVISL